MTKKNLLIDEYPLLVLPSLATAIGLNEAIALQQIHYWIGNPKGGVEIEGEKWVYNTYEEWQEDNFPFWSLRTIQRTFLHLEEMELIISKQEASYDRKKYYRPHYAKLALWNAPNPDLALSQDGTMDDDKMAPSIKGITETTPETTNTANENSNTELDFEKMKLAGQKAGKGWKHREKFSFHETVLDFADLAVSRFGEPSKKDVSLWVMEIGSWVDTGARVEDWPRAVEIVSGYSQPVISITGMTKAVKFAAQERKNGGKKTDEERPEYKHFVPEEGNYVPRPVHLKPNIKTA